MGAAPSSNTPRQNKRTQKAETGAHSHTSEHTHSIGTLGTPTHRRTICAESGHGQRQKQTKHKCKDTTHTNGLSHLGARTHTGNVRASSPPICSPGCFTLMQTTGSRETSSI